ncbi:unnamed protein product [Trifolium pratense]|uniref:Uncharacterized protein n=1 Tax=Trifolium pratense TaxID=57577 RepID=A0ACB0KYQ0_TRIPR|nr:unnamed protein product [Trifolium pratense]
MIPYSSLTVSFPNSVKTLNGTNYEDWKDSLNLYLPLHDFDLALRIDKPAAITAQSTEAQKTLHEKWEASNRKCVNVISYTMEKSIRQSIPEIDVAKDYLKAVGKKFTRFDKAKKSEYLSLFDKTLYDGVSGVREHIMKMIHYYNKLKELKVEIGEDTLIWRVLQSLPPQFDVMRTSYNTQKAEWTIDEMIAIITQEEETFKKGKEQSVQFAAASTSGMKVFRGNNYKGRNHHHDRKKGKATHNLEPKKKIFK